MAIRKSFLFHENDEKEMFVYQILQKKKRKAVKYLVQAVLFYEYSQKKLTENKLIDQQNQIKLEREKLNNFIQGCELPCEKDITEKVTSIPLQESKEKRIPIEKQVVENKAITEDDTGDEIDPKIFGNVHSFLSSL